LHAEIATHVGGLGLPWEVLYVDDRSTDGSLPVLLDLVERDPHVRVVQFRRNYGQTAAMAAGFEHARGSIVVTLDADLQNDPADVGKLVLELERGADIVVGWRRDRQDGFVLRRLPSRLANRLIGLATGVHIHDTGCTLKAFRRELVQSLSIYSEQHRFLPMLAKASGARIREVEVNHRPRRFGSSKYGLGRTRRVLIDLLSIAMLASFSRRPLQFFARLSAPLAAAMVLILATGIPNWRNLSLRNHWWESVLVATMFFSACAYLMLLGLLAELALKASGMHGRGGGGLLVGGREGA
jgi:glycosyltransferase involved in cell wall biosynthesis